MRVVLQRVAQARVSQVDVTPHRIAQIEQGLLEIKQEIEDGRFQYSSALEDIHMHIESALIERIGDVGRILRQPGGRHR